MQGRIRTRFKTRSFPSPVAGAGYLHSTRNRPNTSRGVRHGRWALESVRIVNQVRNRPRSFMIAATFSGTMVSQPDSPRWILARTSREKMSMTDGSLPTSGTR